jgi:hypothetical protein
MERDMKTYVARRDNLKVLHGYVHGGQAFPAEEVTFALLNTGWVSEGVGVLPTDVGTHDAFQARVLASLVVADQAKKGA